MDVATDLEMSDSQLLPENSLSYDDSVAYEEQVPTSTETSDPRSSLASRIGNAKIYLLAETSAAARNSKRKHDDDDDDDEVLFDPTKRFKKTSEENEVEMEELGFRTNAILLQGSPISHLPTARLFAYARHFDTTPLGLEWVNDTTCIFVFESSFLARTAFTLLQKSTLEDPDEDDLVTAKPIPIALWPPESRINKTLGTGEGLKGVVKMRWAKPDDVKKKGAKNESEFYKRHGVGAGKELINGRDLPSAHRTGGDSRDRRTTNDDKLERQRLDAELDQFLRDSEDETEGIDEIPARASPPSRMRSDYIAEDGRTLLDRFSDSTLLENDRNPADRSGHGSRLMVPLPRRARGGAISQRRADYEGESGTSSLLDRLSQSGVDSDGGRRTGLGRYNRDMRDMRDRKKRRGGEDRPQKTQQELDDELDAFLRQE